MNLNDRLITAENLSNALSRAGRPNKDAQAHLKNARRALNIQDRLDLARQESDAALETFQRIMSGSAAPGERESANFQVDRTRKQLAAVHAQLSKNGTAIENLTRAEHLLKIRAAA